jgi:hypothetical protein
MLDSVESSTRDDEGTTAASGEAEVSDDGNFWGAIDAEAVDFLGQQKGGAHRSSLLLL